MSGQTPTVGILAYGSLIDEPGNELGPATVEIIRGVITPFTVEFARKSGSRGDAPTLVPHPDGGHVMAAILVLNADINAASDMLWRRETRCSDRSRGYPGAQPEKLNAVRVERISQFHGIDLVLFTSITANVEPLTARELARLSVASVSQANEGLDGLSYLATAKSNGIVTPLSSAYEEEILRLTGAGDLWLALSYLRNHA